MDSKMENILELMSKFPEFGFSPTDVDLVGYYLKKKVQGENVDGSSSSSSSSSSNSNSSSSTIPVIPELDVIKFDPWDLPGKSEIKSEREWLYFNSGVRKFAGYTRKTEHGYWKQIGTERLIRPNPTSNPIGIKRTMVFFTGIAPKGVKSLWFMHELSMIDQPKDTMSVCRLIKNKDPNLKDPIPKPKPKPNTELGVDNKVQVSKDSNETQADTMHDDTVSAFDILCCILRR